LKAVSALRRGTTVAFCIGEVCAKSSPSPDHRQLFRHVLHDVASGISGLGAVLEMMALEDGPHSEDRAEMLVAARAATERLRVVITGARELAAPFERNGSATPIAVRALLKLVDVQTAHHIIRTSADSDALDAEVAGDVTLLAAMIRALVRNGGDDVEVRVTADASTVRFDIRARARRAITSHTIDYLAECAAARHGTALERTAMADGQSIAITLPRWTWTGVSAA
jgi:hypothetical protein